MSLPKVSNTSPTVAMVKRKAIMYTGGTESTVSFTTTKAKPHIAVVTSIPIEESIAIDFCLIIRILFLNLLVRL